MKNKTTALILAVLVGGLGIDRFYLDHRHHQHRQRQPQACRRLGL